MESLRKLWEANRRWVAAVILAHKPRWADLDDLLQDVATTVVRKINQVREEAAFKESEARHRGEGHSLDERERALADTCARITAERDAVAGTLPEDLLARFKRVARLRGAAVAEARDGTCEACHLKLRLQMYVELKRNDQIVERPGCSRILYYVPPPPTVSPEP